MKYPPLLFLSILLLTISVSKQQTSIQESATGDVHNSNGELVDGLVELETNDSSEHVKNFKKISEDLMEIQEAYEECINNIPDNDFSELSVNECVGKDFIFVLNDIAYERKKIISRADSRIRKHFIEDCYKVAGLDNVMSNGCDLLEKDILDLLWAELAFSHLVEFNRHKYLYEFGKLPLPIFNQLVERLKDIEAELNQLVTEIYDHNDVTIIKLKKHIDARTRKVIERARESYENPQPKLYKHVIEIQEKVNTPRPINVNNVPRPVVMDASNQMYAMHDNPYVEDFHNETNNELRDGQEYAEMNTEGPIIHIPSRKLNDRKEQKVDNKQKAIDTSQKENNGKIKVDG